jgi:hypothetical protein
MWPFSPRVWIQLLKYKFPWSVFPSKRDSGNLMKLVQCILVWGLLVIQHLTWHRLQFIYDTNWSCLCQNICHYHHQHLSTHGALDVYRVVGADVRLHAFQASILHEGELSLHSGRFILKEITHGTHYIEHRLDFQSLLGGQLPSEVEMRSLVPIQWLYWRGCPYMQCFPNGLSTLVALEASIWLIGNHAGILCRRLMECRNESDLKVQQEIIHESFRFFSHRSVQLRQE